MDVYCNVRFEVIGKLTVATEMGAKQPGGWKWPKAE
jgi:hypothetical protein